MTRIALLALAAGAVYMLRRSFRVEPDAGALCPDEVEPEDYAGDYGAMPRSWTVSSVTAPMGHLEYWRN